MASVYQCREISVVIKVGGHGYFAFALAGDTCSIYHWKAYGLRNLLALKLLLRTKRMVESKKSHE